MNMTNPQTATYTNGQEVSITCPFTGLQTTGVFRSYTTINGTVYACIEFLVYDDDGEYAESYYRDVKPEDIITTSE